MPGRDAISAQVGGIKGGVFYWLIRIILKACIWGKGGAGGSYVTACLSSLKMDWGERFDAMISEYKSMANVATAR